jgi:hypothetical protein
LLQLPVSRRFFGVIPSRVYNYAFRELRNMDGPEHTSSPHRPHPTLLNATRTIASWPEAP